MVPHNERFRYIVKQTEIILAPNQPTIQQHMAMNVEETYESEEDDEPTDTHKTTNFNEEDEDKNLEDLWFPGHHPHQDRNSQAQQHRFYSFCNCYVEAEYYLDE